MRTCKDCGDKFLADMMFEKDPRLCAECWSVKHP